MKKVFSILCACALLLPLVPTLTIGASAADTAVITVETVKSAPMEAGHTFTVSISTNRIAKVAGLELHLKYDASKLKAVSGVASGWLSELEMHSVNCDPKKAPPPSENGVPMKELILTGMSLKDKDSANGEVIATITFKTLKEITADVPLKAFGENNMVLESDVTALPLSIVNGGLKITKTTAKITAESATAAYAYKDKIASVNVTAVGDGLSYTWYIKNANQTKYSKSSVTSATYATKMTSATTGRRVYCVVKDRYGNTKQSKTFIMRMQATITSVPSTAVYAAMGAKASVKIGAAGDGLTYTWYIKNDGQTKYSKPSLTGATYTTAMSGTTKGRRLYCVVKDQYGKTAQTKTFILRESVSIVTQPKTAYAKNGEKVSVSVKASGDGLTYTWYIKNAGQTKYTKSSVTGPTYTTKMSSTSKDRLLSCKVRDKYGNEVRANTVQLKRK